MSTASATIPQPLTGEEIRTGIAARISAEMPTEHRERIREIVYEGLGRTCSLESSAAYSKFKADWVLSYCDEKGFLIVKLIVAYELDDFGRVTKNTLEFGDNFMDGDTVQTISGSICEVPPDRFRRETDQPIPKPTELKKPDPQQVSFSKSMRGPGKRRDV